MAQSLVTRDSHEAPVVCPKCRKEARHFYLVEGEDAWSWVDCIYCGHRHGDAAPMELRRKLDEPPPFLAGYLDEEEDDPDFICQEDDVEAAPKTEKNAFTRFMEAPCGLDRLGVLILTVTAFVVGYMLGLP